MKKICYGIALCLCLSACQKPMENEENAVLKVAVHDEEYGNALKKMWEETYQDSEIHIDVVNQEDINEKLMNQEELEYDVYWIEDEMVPVVMDSLNESKEVQVKLNTHFNELFGMRYLPLFAEGESYYMLDLNKIEQDGIPLDTFKRIETISELENGFYYLDDIKYTASFLTSNMNYFPGKDKEILNFTGNSFKEALIDYRKILELIECDDKAAYDNWFINDSYYSGFVNDSMQIKEDEEINGGRYQIVPLPTINNHPLYTRAISYGYVINSATSYPNAAENLIQMIHSKEGVQLLCSDERWIPLIIEDEIQEFTFQNEHIKEKAMALNHAVSRNWVGMEKKEGGAADFLYLDEIISQMKECDLESVEEFQKELDAQYQMWLK